MNLTMMGINKTKRDFEKYEAAISRRVLVCAGTGCLVNGSLKIYEELIKAAKKAKIGAIIELKKEEEGVFISKTGCQGFCQIGPLVTILPEGILYRKVKIEDVGEIVEKTLRNGETVTRLLYVDPETQSTCLTASQMPFYRNQQRFVLKNCGLIDPENINEYIAKGGYMAAVMSCSEMTPEEVCDRISESGLRGRGGGGFPTGKKWHAARIQENSKKYVICNGDEGDPGAFMDMGIM
ncbi:MAG TPA: NAD(P)H-dependent oxidoreductase subunit E, partial [Syntrophorhabdaceae bacterium]|nr:NAD(P)H-dependent oxidoreductase subunit E [Syntrophorhabdaceae bacterium]